MLSWAQTQKLKLVVGAALIVAVALVLWLLLPERSSCSNGVRDGGERGVDCGGSCKLLCRGEAIDPIVQFARAVPVAPSLWGAVAYVENKNENTGARNAPYAFKLYDEHNLLLFERYGAAYIPPRKVFAIFEGRMYAGDRVPTRATFAFTAPPRFEVIPDEVVLSVRNKRFFTTENGSRLEATLANPILSPLSEIEATAALFDQSGNIFAASATKLHRLAPSGTAALSFTWPISLNTPSRVEILYTVPGRN